jgi:hypothetical protein
MDEHEMNVLDEISEELELGNTPNASGSKNPEEPTPTSDEPPEAPEAPEKEEDTTNVDDVLSELSTPEKPIVTEEQRQKDRDTVFENTVNNALERYIEEEDPDERAEIINRLPPKMREEALKRYKEYAGEEPEAITPDKIDELVEKKLQERVQKEQEEQLFREVADFVKENPSLAGDLKKALAQVKSDEPNISPKNQFKFAKILIQGKTQGVTTGGFSTTPAINTKQSFDPDRVYKNLASGKAVSEKDMQSVVDSMVKQKKW